MTPNRVKVPKEIIIIIIIIIIGAIGTISKSFIQYTNIPGKYEMKELQKKQLYLALKIYCG